LRLWIVGILPICSRFSSWFNEEFAKVVRALGIDGEVIGAGEDCVDEMTNYFTNEPRYIEFELNAVRRVLSNARRGDKVLWLDLDYPGFSVPSAFLLANRGVENYGVLHGAYFNEGDVWSGLPSRKWFMRGAMEVARKVFVATNYFKNRLVEEVGVSPDKVVVTGLPFDPSLFEFSIREKQSNKIVVVIGNDSISIPDYNVIVGKGLSRKMFIELLAKARYVVVNKRAETFGYAALEALASGAIVIAPSKFSYPEFKHPLKPDLLFLVSDVARDAPRIIGEFQWSPVEVMERYVNTLEVLSRYRDSAKRIVKEVLED